VPAVELSVDQMAVPSIIQGQLKLLMEHFQTIEQIAMEKLSIMLKGRSSLGIQLLSQIHLVRTALETQSLMVVGIYNGQKMTPPVGEHMVIRNFLI
jgi:hypothetical protein